MSIVASVFLHGFDIREIPKFEICFSADSVDIGLAESNMPIRNIIIEYDGVPGAMVVYDRIMIIAFLDRDIYLRNKNTTAIWGEPNNDGVIIGYTPTIVTSGPYVAMPYEVLVNRGHTPDSEGRVVVIDYRDFTPFYRKSSVILT